MKQIIDATAFTGKGISVNTLTMDLGKFGLSVKEDDSGKLIFHIQVNTRNQRDFENSLKKLIKLLELIKNDKEIIFYFEEFLDISGVFEDYFIKSGVSIEKKKQQKSINQQIWLIRHGYYDFSTGQLTEKGIDRVEKAAAVFRDKRIAVYFSPVTRCVETAAILKNRIIESESHQMPWLGDFAELPENWLSHLQGETIVIVSHHPILCTIAQQLTDNFDFFNFTCGWPVELVSTEQGISLRSFDGNL
jgi:phosphohistidine phosphatase SixA